MFDDLYNFALTMMGHPTYSLVPLDASVIGHFLGTIKKRKKGTIAREDEGVELEVGLD